MRVARGPYLKIFLHPYSRRTRALSISGHGAIWYKRPLRPAILHSAGLGKVGRFSRAARLVLACLEPFSCLGRVTPTASKDLPMTCGRRQRVGASLNTPMLPAEIIGPRKSKRSTD